MASPNPNNNQPHSDDHPSIRSGTCPECGGTDIRIKKGRYTNIPVMFQHPLITAYVCTSCGYIAQFIDKEHLGHIVKNWDHIDGRKRKNDEL